MNTKIVVSIVAAIMVIAGAGVFFMYGNDRTGAVEVDASLAVMGNADRIHQEFMDEFMGYLGDFDVSKDMTCMITYSDVSA